MSKMVACKRCGEQVGELAKTCPKCGVSSPGITVKDALGGLALLGVIGGLLVWWSSSPNDTPDKENAELSAASLAMVHSVPLDERVAPNVREASDYILRVDNAIDNRYETLGKETGATLRDANITMNNLFAEARRWPPDHPCSAAAEDAAQVWQAAKDVAREMGLGDSQEQYKKARELYAADRDECLAQASAP